MINTDQLMQFLKGPIWDGDLISKSETERLLKNKIVDRARGFTFITKKGIQALDDIGILKRSMTKR